jgi:hypothetical protein
MGDAYSENAAWEEEHEAAQRKRRERSRWLKVGRKYSPPVTISEVRELALGRAEVIVVDTPDESETM